MAAEKASKVTISLLRDVLAIADRMARERSTTRSGLIAQLLKKAEEDKRRALLPHTPRPQGLVPQSRPNADESFRTILWEEPWG